MLTWLDSVQHCECVVRRQGCDVQVVDRGLLSCQRRQLVEVGGEQAEAADFGGDVLADGPGQTEAVVGGRASAELVDYDERLLCGRTVTTTTQTMRKPSRICSSVICITINKACLFLPQNGGCL